LGDSLIEKIRAGIDDMDYLAVVLSPVSVESEWVKREVDIAMNQEIRDRKVKVLPLLCGASKLPGFLEGKLYADFSKPENHEAAFQLVLNRLGLSSASSTRSLNDIRREQGELRREAELARKQQIDTVKDGLLNILTKGPGDWDCGAVTASFDGILLKIDLGEIYPGNARDLAGYGWKIENFGWSPPPNCPPDRWNWCEGTWELNSSAEVLDKVASAIVAARDLEHLSISLPQT